MQEQGGGRRPREGSRWRGRSKPGARIAPWRVLLEARAPGAAVGPLKELSADVATRVGETRGLGAAGLNPEGRPVTWV